ncbi:MAG TPA: FAD-dependent thymidylate synthase [Trueperaceae bacterium]|nr:FAD-dependent thymidylate synthase [Trueperaceae bacterium]
MARISVPEADALLDKEFPVLDHGFVRLVDYLGGDARIVQAARVSYGEGTKTVREDRALIDYLLRNRHTSPFEQVIFTFHVKMPIFVARQWIRHRTARLNEISGRYSVMRDEFYLPRPFEVRTQGRRNRQVGEEVASEDVGARAIQALRADQETVYQHYEAFLEDGVARELARINLPLSLYTEMYWQIDLNNLFHFLRLRLDWHAQYEIRAYGDAMATMVRAVCPLAFEAFEEHELHGRTLSGSELEVLRQALDPDRLAAALEASPLRTSRRRELLEKLGVALDNGAADGDGNGAGNRAGDEAAAPDRAAAASPPEDVGGPSES